MQASNPRILKTVGKLIVVTICLSTLTGVAQDNLILVPIPSPTPVKTPAPVLGGFSSLLIQGKVAEAKKYLAENPNIDLEEESPVGLILDERLEIPKTLRFHLEKDSGLTALYIAGCLGQKEIVKKLLEKEVNTKKQTNRYKEMPHEMALNSEQIETAQLILKTSEDGYQTEILVDLENQEATLTFKGNQILKTTLSSGKSGYRTPKGTYIITQKSKNHTSSIYHVKMPYFMRLSNTDKGFHAGHVTGRPASHGCVRLPKNIAKEFYENTPVGTKVTIN